MSHDASFLPEPVRHYVDGLFPVPFKNMDLMEREIAAEGQPAVGRSTGSALRALVAASGGVRVLEVGTNVGYSALWMGAGLPNGGRMDTIELNGDIASRARRNIANAGLATRITVHQGAALDVLPRLQAPYDFIFLDAAKAEYPAYLQHALRLLRSGGIVAADNAFWLGRAWDASAKDADTEGVREYTRRVTTDPKLVTTLVPSEDGLLVSVVMGPR
ncbi:MAG: O-methyltransferase [Candidatus Thermoplasmatota archaeon]